MNRNRIIWMLAVAVTVPVALACIHKPKAYKGSIEQTAQSAIIFWHDGREELILKNDFRITPGTDGQLPASLAWVVPVPSKPDSYSVEKIGMFQDMFDAWENKWSPGQAEGPSDDAPDALEDKSKGIKLLQKVRTGEYEIQPIELVGEDGGKALNKWLATNGFGTVPEKNMAYYVQRRWIWLAVKVNLSRGTATAVRRGGLRPLRISFASDAIVYPLLFSTHQGVFDVNLWVITGKKIPDVAKALKTYRFKLDGSIDLGGIQVRSRKYIESLTKKLANATDATQRKDLENDLREARQRLADWHLPASVERVRQKATKEGKWKPMGGLVVHKLLGLKVNGKTNPLTGWKTDFRIKVGE